MVLRLLRDLLNMAFKVINENTSHDSQECQLLVATLRSPKTVRHRWLPDLVVVNANHCKQLSHASPPARVLSKLWTLLGWLLCSAWSMWVSFLKFLLYRKISQTFWVQPLRPMFCVTAEDPQVPLRSPQEAQGSCPGSDWYIHGPFGLDFLL